MGIACVQTGFTRVRFGIARVPIGMAYVQTGFTRVQFRIARRPIEMAHGQMGIAYMHDTSFGDFNT